MAVIVVPERPFCSRCLKRVNLAVQFFAVSGEHGAAHPTARGSKRSIRLCRWCLTDLLSELKKGARIR